MQKYSVLMSLYKKEHPEYLRLALDSMLNQTVSPDEIVLVEDGPLTDELYAVVDAYKEHLKLVVNEKNLGLGLALNAGLKVCQNEFVARMDTDDISKPDRCEKQLKRFEEKPELAIVGSYIDEFVGDPSNVVSQRRVPTDAEAIFNYAKRRSAFNHPAVMYTEKGRDLIESLPSVEYIHSALDKIQRKQGMMHGSAPKADTYDDFWTMYLSRGFMPVAKKYGGYSIKARCKRVLRDMLTRGKNG